MENNLPSVEGIDKEDIEQIEMVLEIKEDSVQLAHSQQLIGLLYAKYKSYSQQLAAKEKEIEGLKEKLQTAIGKDIAQGLLINHLTAERDHYKALYEAVEKLVDKNGWGNEAEWLQYQSLKIQTP